MSSALKQGETGRIKQVLIPPGLSAVLHDYYRHQKELRYKIKYLKKENYDGTVNSFLTIYCQNKDSSAFFSHDKSAFYIPYIFSS